MALGAESAPQQVSFLIPKNKEKGSKMLEYYEAIIKPELAKLEALLGGQDG